MRAAAGRRQTSALGEHLGARAGARQHGRIEHRERLLRAVERPEAVAGERDRLRRPLLVAARLQGAEQRLGLLGTTLAG